MRIALVLHQLHIINAHVPALDALAVLPVAARVDAPDKRNLGALAKPRRERFGALAEHDAIRPVGVFAPRSVSVRRALIDRQRERNDGVSALRVTQLGICAEIARKRDLV